MADQEAYGLTGAVFQGLTDLVKSIDLMSRGVEKEGEGAHRAGDIRQNRYLGIQHFSTH